MAVLFRLIYYVALLTVLILVLLVMGLGFTSLEFASARMKDAFPGLFLIVMLLAILASLSRLGYGQHPPGARRRRIVITLLIAMAVFVVYMLIGLASFGSSMCGEVTGETLYVKRGDAGTRIVRRYFGCGATDSTPATVHIARQRSFTPWFYYYQAADTAKLNFSEWERVGE